MERSLLSGLIRISGQCLKTLKLLCRGLGNFTVLNNAERDTSWSGLFELKLKLPDDIAATVELITLSSQATSGFTER